MKNPVKKQLDSDSLQHLRMLKWRLTPSWDNQLKLVKLFGSDKAVATFLYRSVFGRNIDWQNPSTLNEKIQLRKVVDTPAFSFCSDKYLVRQYVRHCIGEGYLLKLYLVTPRLTVDHIAKLPNAFVLKANHDCGSTTIVRDKASINVDGLVNKMNGFLRRNYYKVWRERHYKGIRPLIIAEEVLPSSDGIPVFDYKCHCFDGKVAFIQVADDTHTHNNMFTADWEPLPFAYLNERSPVAIPKPEKMAELLHVAEKLSEPFDYVRVDLYAVDNRIYFGELTFTPNGGVGRFCPAEFDEKYGSLFHVSSRNYHKVFECLD